jgi:hypothetical protein
MRKQKNSMVVLAIIMAFVATALLLPGMIGAGKAEPNRPPNPRFTDNGNGTVTDNRTDLIWLKNANCFGANNWDDAMDKAATLHTGECGLADGSRKGDWRLPTKEEWEAFVDKNYFNPVLSNAAGTGKWSEGDAFNNVQSGTYWSSTTHVSYNTFALEVYMYDGRLVPTRKTDSTYVWPVRSGK